MGCLLGVQVEAVASLLVVFPIDEAAALTVGLIRRLL
jgi:hypothetical protein